jgi:hypothetical protein
MDVEPAEAIHTLQFPESIERNFAGTSNKLKKLGALFFIKRPNSSPKPLNLWRSGSVVMILGIVLPIIDINIW